MRRIVVTGSECTGKTTLARALASHYRCVCIPEYAREFVLEKGAPPEFADVESIAHGQLALEGEASRRGIPFVVQDTDLLSTVTYSRHYYGECPAWIEELLARHVPELYVLADIDVPWEADGDQRDRGHMRDAMQALFRDALAARGWPFVEVSGPVDQRLRTAVAAIG